MSKQLSRDVLRLDGMGAALAVHKPAVIGAAMRIFALGGSSLSDAERGRAGGSAYLYSTHSAVIMDLVAEFERRAAA